MKTSEITLTIVFTSLYAVLLILLAPISFGPIQLRVADCLIPLAALFGWPAITGVTMGCLIGNAYFWLGPQDVIFGTIANLIAATIVFLFRKRQLLACTAGAIPIGVIVGGYLWLFFGFEADIFGLQLPAVVGMITSVTLSTMIVMSVLGYALLKALSSSSVVQALKSYGVKIYATE
ncbi:MAG: QueT transporter family protein [Candidatus Bathyarchaeota archaeon]|nr:QueT transporter family protein [Candidatus Bathyarchaeum tardum]